MSKIMSDCFDSAGHLRGQARTYEAVKAAVVDAGRFTVFEADESPGLFTRLGTDPEIEMFDVPFPWIGVRLRLPVPKEARG